MECCCLSLPIRPWTFLSRSKPYLASPQRSFPSPSRPLLASAQNRPKGFGAVTTKRRKKGAKKQPRRYNGDDDDDDDDGGGEEEEDEEEGEDEDAAIPEAVTNRMMKRIGLTVGIPLLLGLLFFPLFYYRKVVAKVDVPTWIPFLVSFSCFGAAFLGVSYGIVSSSWDPLREGSLLGWNEAQRNWPVFWDSLFGRRDPAPKRRSRRYTCGPRCRDGSQLI